MTKALAFLTVALLALAIPLAAHHSFAAEYDSSKPVDVMGTLTRVEWSNPHIWFYLDVKDDKGNITNWGFSAAPPGVLMRRGIQKEVLKVGAVIHVQGFRAKDGSNNASGGTITFTDGRRVLTASSEDAVPGERK
jgi:Family of unknown function (DUF6152)